MKHTPALTYCLTQMRNAIVKGEPIVARDFAVSIMRAYRGTLGYENRAKMLPVDLCQETAYGSTVRLPFQIRCF